MMRLKFKTKNNAGNIAVEMALLAPLLIILLTGMFDFGTAINERMKLTSAVRAGIQYAMHHSADPEIVKQTVLGALGAESTGTTVTVSQSAECADGSEVDIDGSCGAALKRTFVNISAQRAHETIFNYPAVPAPVSLSATASVRVE